MDSLVSPARVFARQAQDQHADGRTVGGRPRRFGLDACACRCFIRLRCQRSIVSGRTTRRSRRKTDRGSGCNSAARNARSAGVKVTGSIAMRIGNLSDEIRTLERHLSALVKRVAERIR